MPFTASSSWTWVGHPVSGLPELTLCPIKTRFPFGSVPKVLNLASPGNSPDRSTKSTRSHFVVLPQLVNTGFQVLFHSPPGVLFTFPSLFHSPPGVLFTFPSQYYALSVTKEYLGLRGGPRSFPQGSTCLVVLWIPPCQLAFHVRGFHPLWQAFPKPFH